MGLVGSTVYASLDGYQMAITSESRDNLAHHSGKVSRALLLSHIALHLVGVIFAGKSGNTKWRFYAYIRFMFSNTDDH